MYLHNKYIYILTYIFAYTTYWSWLHHSTGLSKSLIPLFSTNQLQYQSKTSHKKFVKWQQQFPHPTFFELLNWTPHLSFSLKCPVRDTICHTNTKCRKSESLRLEIFSLLSKMDWILVIAIFGILVATFDIYWVLRLILVRFVSLFRKKKSVTDVSLHNYGYIHLRWFQIRIEIDM